MKTTHLIPLAIAVLSAFSLPPSAVAEVPNLINYQGRLRDNLGLPLNGTVNVQINLFTNELGGAAVYTQAIGAVPVTNGLYSFAFGDASLPGLLSQPEVWLGVTVDGHVLTPRQRLLAVPYAVVAGTVLGKDLFVNPGNGFVGVGTQQPATPLHVLDELGGNALRATRNSDVSGIIIGGQGGGRHLIVNDIDRARWALATGGYGLSFQNDFQTNWQTKVYLAAEGNVGIGTISPEAKLSLFAGNLTTNAGDRVPLIQCHLTDSGNAQYLQISAIRITNGFGWTSAPLRIGRKVDYTDVGYVEFTGHGVALGTTSGEALRVADNGNVGIGSTTPSYKLHVNGSVAGVGAYKDISDARLKKNIAPLTNALAAVEALRGVRFDWRTEEHPELNFEAGPQLGLIAQEVEQVLPEAVSQDAQGTRSVAYSKLIPVLIEAIKTQQREIKELKRKVAVQGH